MKLAALFLLLISVASAQTKKAEAPKPETKHECKAGPEEWCPPAAWWADYDHVKQLQKPYTAPPMPKDTADLINGIISRILGPTGGIPVGFRWDDAKQKAVKIPDPKPAEEPKK
jgi:hypothetical protein